MLSSIAFIVQYYLSNGQTVAALKEMQELDKISEEFQIPELRFFSDEASYGLKYKWGIIIKYKKL
jgi:hypothetical protein